MSADERTADLKRREERARLVRERFGRLDVAPASEGQRRLWAAWKLHRNAAALNYPTVFHIANANADAVQEAVQGLVDRHEALRTTYKLVRGELKQIIRARSKQDLLRVDASGWSEDRLKEELEARAAEPFALEKSPALRAELFERGQDAVLLLALHHIAFDGWSYQILTRDLVAGYQAALAGDAPQRTPAPAYSTWSESQRRYLESPESGADRDYWHKLFHPNVERLWLPGERGLGRGDGPQVAGEISMRLESALTERVRRTADSAGVTLFAYLLAAFQALLRRHVEQESVPVLFPMTGRASAQVLETLGYFVNMGASVVEIDESASFTEVLSAVADQVRKSLQHQSYPTSLAFGSAAPGGLDRVSGVSFALEKGPADLGGVMRPQTILRRGIPFALEVQIQDCGEHFGGRFCFDAARVDERVVRQLAERFPVLLESLCRDAEQSVGRATICNQEERTRELERADGGDAGLSPRLLHELVLEQADRTPDAIAVRHASGTWTYKKLIERSRAAAATLSERGVAAEARVAVCMPRTPDALAWMLGTLTAGGAYVPIDPDYPPARIAEILAATAPAAVATTPALADRLPPETVNVVDAARLDAAAPERPPSSIAATPNNLAYILFTSGSTGRPKGVAVEHRSASILVQWAIRHYSTQELRGVLASTAFTFDLSVFEIFVPLACGGAVLLSENLPALSGTALESEVTLINTTPSVMRQYLRANALAPSVAVVNLAGEALTSSLVDEIYDNGAVGRVFDLYGPSEDTTYSTVALRERGAPETIGRPLPQTRAYLLDQQMQCVPEGAPGQLWLGGDGLARGYWNDPEETARRFVKDPFSTQPVARLYQTGDRCRRLPSGDLQFKGRMDDQVKIRGVRIELGDVESTLGAHDGVLGAAATTFESQHHQQALAAFYVANDQAAPSSEQLKKFLAARLPRAMVPAGVWRVDSLPRTAHGKVDRRALATLAAQKSLDTARRGPVAAPRNPNEARMAQLWRRVLGDREFGVDDEFFEVGGDSLSAIHLATEISRELGVEIPAAALLEAPTIAELARRVESGGEPSRWKSLVVLNPNGSKPPLFCFHADSGLVLMYRELARLLADERPVFGVQSVGLSGPEEPLRDVPSMVAAYLAEIRTVQPKGPYHLAGFCMGAYVALETARVLETEGEEVASLAVFAADGEWRMAGEDYGLAFHRENLSRLRGRKRVEYVIERALFRVSRSLSPVGVAARSAWSRWTGQDAVAARHARVQMLNRAANLEFRPKPFAGRVVFFQGREEAFRDPLPFWGPIAAGGVETVKVGGREATTLESPNVERLARELQTRLDSRAKSAANE